MFFAQFVWPSLLSSPTPPPPLPSTSFNVLVVMQGKRIPESLSEKGEGITFIEAQEWVRTRFGDAEDVDYVFRLLQPRIAFWYQMGQRNGETGVLMGYNGAMGLFTPLDDSSPIELQPQCSKRPRAPSPENNSNIVENNTSPPPPPPSPSPSPIVIEEPPSAEPLITTTKPTKRATRKRITLDL